MIKIVKVAAGVMLAALMAACGGGGGSAGTTAVGGGTGGGTGGTGGGSTASPKVTLEIINSGGTATSTIALNTTTYARAVVTDAVGAKVSGAVVTFSGGTGLVSFVPSSGTALTDANGVATVQVLPASTTAAGAGTLTASSSVAGTAVSATASFQVPAGTAAPTPRLSVDIVTNTGVPTSTLSLSTTTYARAVATDATGARVANVVVTFGGGNGLVSTVPSSGSALTDSTGVAMVQVQPANSLSAGAGTLTASGTVAGAALSSSAVFQVLGGSTAAQPKLTLDLVGSTGVTTTTVSLNATTFARAVVTDAAGAKVPGAVVSFSGGSGLVVFAPSSGTALTDSNGVATVQVQPSSATAAGAATLSASSSVGVTPVSASLSFSVPQAVSDSPTKQVANYYLLLDRASLSNGGSATAKLTVTAVDANNNIVPGASVSVTTNNNSIFTPTSGTTTDSAGQYTGQIGFGTDKTDRSIVATVVINGITKTVAIPVVGSKLSVQSTPSTPSPGQTSTATATLLDSSGNPIIGVPVTFSGSFASVQNRVANTDLTGKATINYAAPAAPGIYTISASGSGVQSGDYQLQVFSSTIPTAVIPAGAAPSLAAFPNVLTANTAGQTTNRSTLRFLFLDSTNAPIPNVRVRFADMTTGLPAVNASITAGSSVLYTDSSGTVSTQYIPGPNSSPTNGVRIRACYSAVDFAANFDCKTAPAGSYVEASLTVAGQALAISIGDDNLLARGSGTYIKRFTVTVADSAGRAVPNAPVDISVDLTHFGKGIVVPFTLDIPPVPLNRDYGYPQTVGLVPPYRDTTPSTDIPRIWCPNEDRNRNGSYDPGYDYSNNSFDTNNQPTLEPRKADLLISYDDPAVTTTDSNGILVIKVEYSQRFGTWLAYNIRVMANVAGSQGMAERLFVTSIIAQDISNNGSFLTPPYGTGSCSVPN